MITLHQLSLKKKTRITRLNKYRAPAFSGAPHRKGIIYKITTCHQENLILQGELLLRYV